MQYQNALNYSIRMLVQKWDPLDSHTSMVLWSPNLLRNCVIIKWFISLAYFRGRIYYQRFYFHRLLTVDWWQEKANLTLYRANEGFFFFFSCFHFRLHRLSESGCEHNLFIMSMIYCHPLIIIINFIFGRCAASHSAKPWRIFKRLNKKWVKWQIG